MHVEMVSCDITTQAHKHIMIYKLKEKTEQGGGGGGSAPDGQVKAKP